MTTLLTRLRSRPTAALIAAVALVLAVLLIGYYLSYQLFFRGSDTEEVVNTAGGYSIQVPDGWSATQDGRTTKVTSSDEKSLIIFGLGRTGPMPVAATMFFQQVGANYTDVQVFPPDAQQIGGRHALAYGGIGTNDQDARVRFLAITVENTPTNFGITVFTEANTNPEATLPSVNRIVDSFRTLPPS